METSNSVLVILFIVTLFYAGHSQGGGGDPMACVQKLLPCQPYLKGSSSSKPPPASCCVPINQILATDLQCLCTVFTDPALLKSLNVTQDDAINLANSCGAHADSTLCKPAAAPTTSTPTGPSTNSSTTSPPAGRPNAATSISRVGSLLSQAAIFSFIVFAF